MQAYLDVKRTLRNALAIYFKKVVHSKWNHIFPEFLIYAIKQNLPALRG